MADSYNQIINRVLGRVPANRDKREGSIIYDSIAPFSAEMAQMLVILDIMMDRAFLDTQTGGDLDLKAAEFGLSRKGATYAIRQGIFTGPQKMPFDVEKGKRFSGDSVNYVVLSKIEAGLFRMQAETPGEAGNEYFGRILPIDYIDGLVSAELGEILVPGEETESDESLRQRIYDVIDGEAFGGNIKDYQIKTLALDGVGQVKVFPIWNGGGSVKLVIVDSTGGVPSSALIDYVQTAIDPETNHGEGMGIAPIGHTVTVVGAKGAEIDITTSLEFQEGYSFASLLPVIEEKMQEYFASLIANWQNQDSLIIRVSQIESRILDIEGIVDIQNTQINGSRANIVLGEEEIPILGEVTNT